MNISTIPIDFDEFLLWFQQQTEEIWSQYNTLTFDDFKRAGVGGSSWRRGTKWLGGFSEGEIASAEQDWKIHSPPDYRHFLSVLGAPDRTSYGAGWGKAGMVENKRSSFYNWRKDPELAGAMNWPLDGLYFDLEHNQLWHERWGNRPDSLEDQKEKLSKLVQSAPPLIPIIGHRYLVGAPIKEGNPVLSVYQSDIVIYGADLRKFLINEFSDFFGIDRSEAFRHSVAEFSQDSIANIPFWGEFIVE